MEKFLIGLDLGTTGCKAAVMDTGLKIHGEAYLECGLITMAPGEIEQDADEWWSNAAEAVRLSLRESGAKPADIAGISVSSQGIAFVPVDAYCRPLRNAISWLDMRAAAETDEILERYKKEDIFRITGKRISELYTLPKLLWLKRHEPEIYEKAFRFLMPHDYIVAKLCGEFVTDHTMASGTLAYDIINRRWYGRILDDFGIDTKKLPRITESGSVCGRVIGKAEAETGIPEGTCVCTGGQDQKCAALGAGINENTVTVSLGTATAVEKLLKKPYADDRMGIPVFSYLFDGAWTMEGVINTSGVCLKWFRDLFAEKKSYKDIDAEIEALTRPDAKVFFYPYLGGSGSPEWYNDAKGCFYGLDLSTGTADMARGILEGIAFSIRANIEYMENAGGPVNELRLFGGGASSSVWCRIISDVTKKRVYTLETQETACLGAGMLAGIGTGYIDMKKENISAAVKDTFVPDMNNMAIYENKYKEYISLGEKIMRRCK